MDPTFIPSYSQKCLDWIDLDLHILLEGKKELKPSTPSTPSTPSGSCNSELDGEMRRTGECLAQLAKLGHLTFSQFMHTPAEILIQHLSGWVNRFKEAHPEETPVSKLMELFESNVAPPLESYEKTKQTSLIRQQVLKKIIEGG